MAYGADSVYLAGKRYGMRAMAGNLSDEELRTAVDAAHQLGRKVYVTVNLFARDHDLIQMDAYLMYLDSIGVDAIIVADPGVLARAKHVVPNLTIHLSTQANTLNADAAKFWYDAGVKRIVLARELSLAQIAAIRQHTPDDLELEVFAHGSMCMAYSGRCAISTYLTGREANQGLCTQPCRWEYSLIEGKRDGEVFTIEEDTDGMYFFNSKDLNMLPYLKDLIETGIDSLKVEGRMKSEHYVAAVSAAYRNEINAYYANPAKYEHPASASMDQLGKVTYRPYTTGFNYGNPHEEGQSVQKSEYIAKWSYIGKVVQSTDDPTIAWVKEYNPFHAGQVMEVLHPDGQSLSVKLLSIEDEDGHPMEMVKLPKQVVKVQFDKPVQAFSILRKKVDETT